MLRTKTQVSFAKLGTRFFPPRTCGDPVVSFGMLLGMTYRLRRYHHEGHAHFVTFSCAGRMPYFASEMARDLFEDALEKTRVKHGFVVYAYVVMPEHVHLLMSEPANLSKAIHALKLSVSKRSKERPFWLSRSHGFNVFSERKFNEKIEYIHANPVHRGLVPLPELWRWSSARQHAGLGGRVVVDTGRGDLPDTYQWPEEPGAPPSRS